MSVCSLTTLNAFFKTFSKHFKELNLVGCFVGWLVGCFVGLLVCWSVVRSVGSHLTRRKFQQTTGELWKKRTVFTTMFFVV
jgi:hypothetical protein